MKTVWLLRWFYSRGCQTGGKLNVRGLDRIYRTFFCYTKQFLISDTYFKFCSCKNWIPIPLMASKMFQMKKSGQESLSL